MRLTTFACTCLLLQALLPTLAWRAPVDPQRHWAVLVAGSNGWWNYRHQADISHAYQILIRNGFLKDHIIVFMYDDIANSRNNPFPGKIFNDYSHTDVYHGIKIDFRRENVTVRNFLDILSGRASRDGQPYLNTGPEDYIFLNLVDHGEPGFFCFPEEEMFADDFIDVLQEMHQKKRFKEMAIYVEACESGSLFEHLLATDIHILGVTAANSHEPSYGCYCQDRSISTCLGDKFSVNWMQFLDHTMPKNTTIGEMVEEVRQKTRMSHVSIFGEEDIESETANYFFGDQNKSLHNAGSSEIKVEDLVSSREVLSHYLRRQFMQSESKAARDFYASRWIAHEQAGFPVAVLLCQEIPLM